MSPQCLKLLSVPCSTLTTAAAFCKTTATQAFCTGCLSVYEIMSCHKCRPRLECSMLYQHEQSPAVLTVVLYCMHSCILASVHVSSLLTVTTTASTGTGTDGCWVLQTFLDSSPEQLQQVVSTNMTGTLLCTRAALQVMQKQSSGGHIFNMDGAGADGMPTPQYAAYGATKAGMSLAACTLPQSRWKQNCSGVQHGMQRGVSR